MYFIIFFSLFFSAFFIYKIFFQQNNSNLNRLHGSRGVLNGGFSNSDAISKNHIGLYKKSLHQSSYREKKYRNVRL
jgi:hypothetical protein